MYVRYTPNGKKANGRMTASGVPTRCTAREFEEDRQHERRVRDEHHHERRDEQSAAKLEVGHREGVAGGDRHDDRDHQRDPRVEHRIAEPRPDDAVLERDQLVPVLGELSKEPKLKGSSPLRPLSWVVSFVGASRSHTKGMTKNTAKNGDQDERTRPSHRARRRGQTARPGWSSRGQRVLLGRRRTRQAPPRRPAAGSRSRQSR